ncbi:hypothetical protein Ddc_19793 [Ditylenchus destructor]|nr:hypothetical protein Ddc_19793 [Ditylenchus destructor]
MRNAHYAASRSTTPPRAYGAALRAARLRRFAPEARGEVFPKGKFSPWPNPGFPGLPEAIAPEIWESSSARPVPFDSSHREEAIRISHARIRAASGKFSL